MTLSCHDIFVQGLAHGTRTSEELAYHSLNLLAKTGFIEIKAENILSTIEALQT